MDDRLIWSRHISFRRILDRLPHWAVALLLALLLAAAAQSPFVSLVFPDTWQAYVLSWVFLTPLFLTGAIKRLNWRHALVMLLLAGVALAASEAIEQTKLPRLSWLPAPSLLMSEVAGVILLAGLGEILLTRRWRRTAILWLPCASIAGACLVGVVQDYLSWSAWEVRLPLSGRAYHRFALANVMSLPLQAVVVWLAVPATIRACCIAAGWRRPALAAAIGAAVGGCAAFYGVLLYPLAEQSAHGDGPFPQYRGAMILEWRGCDEDFARLEQILEAADWTLEPNLAALPDWRDVCVCVLARHDSPATAERLSALLAAKPTPTLAWLSAAVLAENKRYEAAPLLARYALRNHNGSEACIDALEEMQIPQAARMILQAAADFQHNACNLPPGEDFELSPNQQNRLAALLECDAGASYLAWQWACDELVETAPTPLSPELTAEIEQVFRCIARYREARNRMVVASRTLAQRMLDESPEQDKTAARDACTRKARKALVVQGPDWTVPTTREFAEEVDAFAARVEASIAKNLGGDGDTGP